MIRYNETGCRWGMCFARGPMVGEIGRSEIPLRVFSWDSTEMERCTMKQNADSEWVCREVKCYCGERAGRSDQISSEYWDVYPVAFKIPHNCNI
jgi:hypothetical protein